ncbi:MAG TPA: flagellar biosynthesis protein FlhA [Terriglobia bacterium]|nr:flagellar biosynthesis protein FlhA [Terriglobia bacterium]
MMKSQIAMPIAITIILIAVIIPLPTIILDVLISTNIALSVVILLSAVYLLNPVQFSSFPSILLMTTLFRLSLNIASTRLILLNGSQGLAAAGDVIRAFGQFVVGGNYAVGIIIFLVLIVIQYVVINHGAVRISEVTARFTLDALPGKQLAIDADLNAGIIDQQEARERRAEIGKEAEFYGAMDGAIRFTQRDAMASVLITLINIIGGLFIGVFQYNMPVVTALTTFTVLTIGDGLVTAIPSLLISIAGGLVTTHAASDVSMGQGISNQLFSNPKPVYFGAGIVAGLGLIPGFPKFSFLFMAGLLGFIAFSLSKAAKERELAPKPDETSKDAAATPDKATSFLKIDSLAIEIGYGLIGFVDVQQGGDFLNRIRSIRKQIAQELGIIVPPVNITDNLKLGPRQYSILLKGIEIARGELAADKFLAINPGNVTGPIEGTATTEPTFGLPAYWISKENREKAQMMNYTVVDPATVLATHLTETIRNHAYELLGRQEVKALIDYIAETHPKLTEELVPKTLSVGEIQKVLQNLLREKVSVRDLITVFETLADYGTQTKDHIMLTEVTRAALSRSITKSLVNDQGELAVITLAPGWETRLNQSVVRGDSGTYIALDANTFEQLVRILSEMCQKTMASQWTLLCSSGLRFHLRKLVERFLPQLTIISPNDIPPNVQIVSLGVAGQ